MGQCYVCSRKISDNKVFPLCDSCMKDFTNLGNTLEVMLHRKEKGQVIEIGTARIRYKIHDLEHNQCYLEASIISSGKRVTKEDGRWILDEI